VEGRRSVYGWADARPTAAGTGVAAVGAALGVLRWQDLCCLGAAPILRLSHRSLTRLQLQLGSLNNSFMKAEALRTRRLDRMLAQQETTQPPFAQTPGGETTAADSLSPTALPLPKSVEANASNLDQLTRWLSGLGYPGYGYLAPLAANPALVVLTALVQENLEGRVAEALPWVLLTHPDLERGWLVRHAKKHHAQNRLGFLAALAQQLEAAQSTPRAAVLAQLSDLMQTLERARLAREGTLCRESMASAEREWLKETRTELARHWRLLTRLDHDLLSVAV
jgi:hypothetical protein